LLVRICGYLCTCSGLVVNSGFPVAVKLDHEVMFSTIVTDKTVGGLAASLKLPVDALNTLLRGGAYIAVPHDYDKRLRELLGIQYIAPRSPREVFNRG
jgi:hypothetical protein